MSCRAVMSVAVLIASAGSAAADGRQRMTLWGIDGDDGQVFSISDVRRPAGTFTDYGPLHVVEDGRLVEVGRGTDAFTVLTEDRAFVALNRGVNGTPGPVLLEVDLRNATPSVPLVGRVRGSIAGGLAGTAQITGIAGDPVFGRMYALASDGDPTTPDRLMRMNLSATGELTSMEVGPIAMGADSVNQGGDLSIGPGGMLLVTDGAQGRVVTVDPGSASIVSPVGRGSGIALGRMGAIAWDALGDRAVLFRGDSRELAVESRGDDDDAEALLVDLTELGVTDAEGLSFVLKTEIEDDFDIRATPGISSASAPLANPGGIPTGGGAAGGGGGGGGGGADLGSLFEPPPVTPQPVAEREEIPEDEPGIDPPDDDPLPPGDEPDPSPPPPRETDRVVPAPGPVALLGLAGAGVLGRRRRR